MLLVGCDRVRCLQPRSCRLAHGVTGCSSVGPGNEVQPGSSSDDGFRRPPPRQRRASVLVGICWKTERSDEVQPAGRRVGNVSVPAVVLRWGIGAELDDVAEVGERVDGPAATAGVTVPDEPSPSAWLLTVGPNGGDPDLRARVGVEGVVEQ